MRNQKTIALALALSVIAPMLMSCAKNSAKDITVRSDDPWYETVRFDLETDRQPSEMVDSSVVTYGNDRLYHLYSLYNLTDYTNYRRSMLDTYDSNGNLLSRVKITDPANYTIDRIQGIKPGKDGNSAEVIMDLFAPGGFETALLTIDLSSGETGIPQFFKNKDGNKLGIQGSDTNVTGVAEVYSAGEYYFPVIYSLGETGGSSAHIYSYRGSSYLCEFDLSGLPSIFSLDEFSFDPKSNTVFTIGYTSTEGPLVLEFNPENGQVVSKEKYNLQDKTGASLADFKAVTSGELFKIDMLGNISSLDMKTHEAKTFIDNNWYSPYFSDFFREEVTLVSCDETQAVIYTSKAVDYSMFFAGSVETVTILKKADKNPHTGKKVIELATPIDTPVTEYLSNAIFEFNRTDNEYLIRVWSKYSTGIKAGRDLSILNEDDEKVYTMIQELNGSDAPDIAIGIQKKYAMRDDVFEDLTGYLEQDVMDKQFANIIDASKIGGKLYFLPVTLEIEGLVIDSSLIDPGECGITFDEYKEMIKNNLDGFSPYDYPLSTYNYKKDFLLSCIDTKTAIEGDRVEFGTDQFYMAVEVSNELFAEDGFTKPDDYIWDDETGRTRTGCRYDRISSYIDFVYACKSDTGDYTIIGTPSVDASGPRFRALETVSVTSVSDRKDGCKKFLNFLFGGAGYVDSSKEFQNIVTNKDVMARNISLITEKNNSIRGLEDEMSEYIMGLSDFTIVYGYKYATEPMEEGFMNSLAAISVYYYDDPVITSFLVEEIAPYYAGDRSLEDAVRIINERVEKYTKEM